MALRLTILKITKLPSNLYPSTWGIVKDSKQHYSVFPSSYLKPVFKPDEQKVIEGTEAELEVKHGLIKPAMTNETSSEFHDYFVRKFSNYIMKDGKRVLAQRLMSETFERIKRHQIASYHKASPEERDNIELDPKMVLRKAIENARPVLELKPMRRGGITYQVPAAVTEERSLFLAMNWLIQTAKDRDRRTILFPEQLAKELLDASYNVGRVVKKKQDLHKQCNANRAYAHYRWK